MAFQFWIHCISLGLILWYTQGLIYVYLLNLKKTHQLPLIVLIFVTNVTTDFESSFALNLL